MDDYLYEGREQSLVKHLILKRYLLRFALIIGRHWPSITYVDCFSGPWKSKSESFEDTSFAIAISQLREARDELKERFAVDLKLRAFFIERDPDAFNQLQTFVEEIDDVEIATRNAELENSIDEIREFVGHTKTFPFIFIDPKGWSGFALDVIRPLLELTPSELLINFMTQHIVRFIDNTASQESFEHLFGSSTFRDRLSGTGQEDRVDAAVFEYRDAVAAAGKFTHPGISGILNPVKNRSHFHLIYLSRNAKGLDVFKSEEKRSMSDMETARARAEQKQREKKTGRLEFTWPDDAPESDYFEFLRDRYRHLAQDAVSARLRIAGRLAYDDAWNLWLRFPMVWESDLKDWIKNSRVRVEGMAARDRVPKRRSGHVLVNDSETAS